MKKPGQLSVNSNSMVCPGATVRYLSCSGTRRVKVDGVHQRRGDDRDAGGHLVAAISHAEADFVAHPCTNRRTGHLMPKVHALNLTPRATSMTLFVVSSCTTLTGSGSIGFSSEV